jgi:hypothetical protein
MLNKSKYQMTKIDSAEPSTRAQAEGLVAGRNMFRKLENLNFVIVSDFEFRASNFRTLCDRVNYASYYWNTILGAFRLLLP